MSRQFGLGQGVDQFGRRRRAVVAHPHVERAIETEREAARRLVKLHRGNAEIEGDAVDALDALGRQQRRHLAETPASSVSRPA